MDVGSLSMISSSSKLQSAVGVAMLSKALGSNAQTGNAVAQMITDAPAPATDPNVGTLFDMKI